VRKTVTPLLKLSGQYVKYVDQYKYLGIVLNTELSDDKDIQRQPRYQYCAANKLRASFSRCSNLVKNIVFRSFCTLMYASQLWCNFKKSCMQRLCVAYNLMQSSIARCWLKKQRNVLLKQAQITPN